MRKLSAVLIVLAVSGCAEPQYLFRKPGAQPGEFERTKAHCHNEGLAIGGTGPLMMTVMLNCMTAHGWQRAN
jgi:hypothetical protein